MVAQIVNKNQPIFTSISDKLPPQNIEAEEAILGGILLDPEAIERVISVLEPSDFSLRQHQTIYHACVAIHSQGKPVNLMSVTTYLADKGLLESVGGQLKLSQLVDRTVSAVNVDQYTNLILEKRLRRQLIEYGNEVINNSFTIDPDEGVGGLLEKMESSFFEIASRFRRGNFVRSSTAKFQAISRELERIEDNYDQNEALKQWELQELAKKYGFKSRREMLNFHVLWLSSRSKNQFMSLKDYLEKYGNASEHWLLRGWIPKQTITLLHAKGGKGKTRLVGHICRVIINGGQWGDYYADKPGYVLFIETDQGDRVTAEQLKEQGYLDDSPEVQERFSILSDWKIEQFGILRQKIAEIKEKDPKANILIMIDSLSSTSTQSLYSENDQEYARPLMRLLLKAAPFQYRSFIKFLFISGCRIGEGLGLQWNDLSGDCSTVTISRQWTQGKIKPLKKGGKPRTFSLPLAFSLEIQSLPRDSDFVFGTPIETETFRLAWIKILEEANVRYRKPYSCRHTFVCHRLQEGWKPTQIVQVTGHSLETMFTYYASYIAEEIHLPDL